MASADGDHPPPRLLSIPKEGERILAPTRRPDGTLRKPIRIRAGYVPQDEVAIYQSKGALLRKASQPEVPPGYDPALAEKPKTKSAKRNERKKEKRHQAAMEREKNMGLEQAEVMKTEEDFSAENIDQIGDSLESVTEKMNLATITETSAVVGPSTSVVEIPKPESSGLITDKKIRALKKKIRLAEAQIQDDQQAMKLEQIEKIRKVEQWHEELKALEDEKKVNLGS